MERAIKHHFGKDIKEKIKLPNGWKETWLLVLSDNQKVVFRAHKVRPDVAKDTVIEANEKMADIYNREKFFYENINKKIGRICPEVYVVDGTCEYYENSYQISKYIEGKNLGSCIKEDLDEQAKRDIYLPFCH